MNSKQSAGLLMGYFVIRIGNECALHFDNTG